MTLKLISRDYQDNKFTFYDYTSQYSLQSSGKLSILLEDHDLLDIFNGIYFAQL